MRRGAQPARERTHSSETGESAEQVRLDGHRSLDTLKVRRALERETLLGVNLIVRVESRHRSCAKRGSSAKQRDVDYEGRTKMCG